MAESKLPAELVHLLEQESTGGLGSREAPSPTQCCSSKHFGNACSGGAFRVRSVRHACCNCAVHTHTHACAHSCTHSMHTNTRAHTHSHMHTRVHAHAHTQYPHTLILTYTLMCTHTSPSILVAPSTSNSSLQPKDVSAGQGPATHTPGDGGGSKCKSPEGDSDDPSEKAVHPEKWQQRAG